MRKTKTILLAILGAVLVGCASQSPQQPFPRSAENSCMVNVFEKIRIVRSNTKEQSNASKENQCFWAAERRAFWSNASNRQSPQSVQNAIGNIVIQQSINVKNDASQAIKDGYYRECMQNPKVQDIVAPPAYVQLEGMTYGFNSISKESCPVPFAALMGKYVQDSQHVVDVMKKYPHLNTAQQNEISRKQVPSNPIEKDIIDASKPSARTYVQMVQFFAKTTGWCPSNNGLFRCDPNNIPFRN